MKKREKLFTKFFTKSSKKAASEILTFIDEDIQKALYRGYELNNIADEDVVRKPILIKAPESFYDNSDVKVVYHGKLNEVIYDQSLFTTLFIGPKSLYYYQAKINHNTGEIAEDLAGEIALDTITTIETFFSKTGKKENNVALDLQLTTADSSTYHFRLRNQVISEKSNEEQPFLLDNEKFVLTEIKEAVRKAY